MLRGAAAPTGATFLYPRTGFGAISEALADAAAEAGADLRLGVSVSTRSTGPRHDRLTVELDDGTGARRRHGLLDRCRSAVLAAVDDAAPPPEWVLEAGRALRHRALVLAYLVVDRPQWTEFDAHYFPGPEVPASPGVGAEELPRQPRRPARPHGAVRRVAVLGGRRRRGRPTPTTLGDRLARSLRSVGLPDPRPVAVEVRRLPRVYPVYRPGFEWDLSTIELWLGADPRLVTLGRQGLFVPDNTHHALAMGWDAAAALRPDGGFDHAGWTCARDRFRSNVVED